MRKSIQEDWEQGAKLAGFAVFYEHDEQEGGKRRREGWLVYLVLLFHRCSHKQGPR